MSIAFESPETELEEPSVPKFAQNVGCEAHSGERKWDAACVNWDAAGVLFQHPARALTCGVAGIEIKSLFHKSWFGKGVAPPPFLQLVSNGVKTRCTRCDPA